MAVLMSMLYVYSGFIYSPQPPSFCPVLLQGDNSFLYSDCFSDCHCNCPSNTFLSHLCISGIFFITSFRNLIFLPIGLYVYVCFFLLIFSYVCVYRV